MEHMNTKIIYKLLEVIYLLSKKGEMSNGY